MKFCTADADFDYELECEIFGILAKKLNNCARFRYFRNPNTGELASTYDFKTMELDNIVPDE